MGGINCNSGISCKIATEDRVNLRLNYAGVVRNIFKYNIYFSSANVKIEELMAMERLANNVDKSIVHLNTAIDDLRKSVSILTVAKNGIQIIYREVNSRELKLQEP